MVERKEQHHKAYYIIWRSGKNTIYHRAIFSYAITRYKKLKRNNEKSGIFVCQCTVD